MITLRIGSALIVLLLLRSCPSDGGGESPGPDAGGGGSSCASTADCAATQWCHFADGLCGGGAAGVCETRPVLSSCTGLTPVCGCDGGFYGNACRASSIGIDGSGDTSCFPMDGGPPSGTPCGDTTCSASEWCDYPDDLCGAGVHNGVCTARPTVSDCGRTLAEVCGCDGHLYGNACRSNVGGSDSSTDTSCL